MSWNILFVISQKVRYAMLNRQNSVISITEALMNKPNEPKELLDELEAAAYLGLKNHKTLAVWRCNKRYDLPYVKYGRLVRYRRKDLQAFVDAHLVPTR
jgi:hypothetical protein